MNYAELGKRGHASQPSPGISPLALHHREPKSIRVYRFRPMRDEAGQAALQGRAREPFRPAAAEEHLRWSVVEELDKVGVEERFEDANAPAPPVLEPLFH